jgi:hypothetical protein
MDAPRFATPCREWCERRVEPAERNHPQRQIHNPTHPFEGVDVGGLVAAREAALVALAVRGDVLPVPLPQLLDRLLDHLVATGLPHRLGAVVGVSAGAVPVTLHAKQIHQYYSRRYIYSQESQETPSSTLIGFGSRERTIPAISVILWKNQSISQLKKDSAMSISRTQHSTYV